MTSKPGIVFRINPQINPSFPEGTITNLAKDYPKMYPYYPYWSEHLQKGAFCVIEQCGLSEYPINGQKGSWEPVADNTDGREWCHVRVATVEADPDHDEGYVRAEDLERYIFTTE